MRKYQETIKRISSKTPLEPLPCQTVQQKQIQYLQKEEKTPNPEQVETIETTATKFMEILPESSVWCTGGSPQNRKCRFRNLCYSQAKEQWFILKSNRSILSNVPAKKQPLLELSSIDHHPYFSWSYIEMSPFHKDLQNINVRYEELTHFMFRRLHPRNIMHNLHDDVLNLYHMIKEYNGIKTEPGRMVLPFSLYAHRILILDKYEGTDSTRPIQYLSNHPLRFKSYLSKDVDITCFRDAILGNTDLTKWYQYGFFKVPQGPVENLPNGMHVREVSEWIVKRMGLPLGFDEVYPNTKQPLNQNHSEDNTHLDFPDTDVIIILSRKSNRLILNEQQLAIDLTKKYGLETKFVSNEDHSFEEQIKIIRRARIVVGMHGSILVMSMFTRRGTVFIEMFPFGVPSKHYTPYKTMSNLPGMDLVYRSWENKHEELSVGYPDRHKLNGGLNDLSAEERQLVLDTKDVPQHICCASPYWLYRIYQDTTVTIHEIISLIDDALEESRMIVLPRVYNTNLFLGNIDVGTVLQIDCVKDPSNLKGTLYARWEDLWNKEVDFWEVLINNDGKIYKTTREPSFILGGFADGDLIVFFVRAVSDGKRADWGTAGQCIV